MASTVFLNVMKLNQQATLPSYKSLGAAGFDLSASEDVEIQPGKWSLVRTGLSFEIPDGYEIQIRSRGGQSMSGLVVMNQPGTVDSDYRGEVKIILWNVSDLPRKVHAGERVAQGVLAPVTMVAFVETHEVNETKRGEGGFGSTGS